MIQTYASYWMQRSIHIYMNGFIHSLVWCLYWMVIFKKLFEVYKWKQFSRHLLRSLLPTSQLHWLQQYDVRYINIFTVASVKLNRRHQCLRWWGRWTSRSCGRWGRWWGRSPWSTCQYRSPASPRSSPEGPVVALVEMEVVEEQFLEDIHCSLSSKKASWRKVTDGNGICWLLNFIKR